MQQRELQIRFLEVALSRYTRKSDGMEVLAKMLDVSRDNIYRRVRGDSLLTPDEMAIIANKLNISLDQLIHNTSNLVTFQYSGFTAPTKSFNDFLKSLDAMSAKVAADPDSHFYYASSEIPVFHYCFFPDLLAFKMFVWARTVWDIEYLRDKKFSTSLMNLSEEQLADSVAKSYINTSTTEIIHLNVIDNSLSQIEYSSKAGHFENPEDALMICDRVSQLVEHLSQMCAKGSKFHPNQNLIPRENNYTVYHNEMVFTNNTFLAKLPEGRTVYTTFDNPNFLLTTDHRLSDVIEDWFKRLLLKSNNISSSHEKNRSWFFKVLQDKIKLVKKRIEIDLHP